MIIMGQGDSILGLLVKLWRHLGHRRKNQFYILAILLPLGGVAEVMSLGAVLPLLTVLIEPETIFKYNYIKNFVSIFNIEKAEQMALPIFIVFSVLVIGSALFRIALLWAMTRVAFGCGADLCVKVYRTTLYQPYSKHISQHSSNVIAGIAGKVSGSAAVLQHVLLLINAAIMGGMILIAMFIASPLIALISSVGIGSIYLAISWQSRKRLLINSKAIAVESVRQIKYLQEGLGAIRDVLIDGTQNIFLSMYQKADFSHRKAQCNNNVIAASPKFMVEALGIILIAMIAFAFSMRSGGVLEVLPVLGLFVLAAQRLLPALQQIYASWAFVAGMQTSLIDAISLLDQKLPMIHDRSMIAGLAFKSKIEAINLGFKYSPEGPVVLANVSFVIERGARIGILGVTGSGKSTLFDILMGLLVPTTGQLVVDSESIVNEKIDQWQKIIAHVPQNIYLTDATVAENIAFGVPLEQIDMERVRLAAERANISLFIDGLELGYATVTGERGARLSGGQRQRLGIARALYKNAKVLLLDEATSALDDATEKSVMDAIEGLGSDITILIIAHRLSTLERCDFIYKVEGGTLSMISASSLKAVP